MKQIDMTCGPIMKKVLLFAIPICAGNLLQQLYNTVDTLVIGNFCGSSSLAAVGTSAQPVEILLCIFLGLGTGVSILASQYVGRNDPETLIELTATSVSFIYALFLCPFSDLSSAPLFWDLCRYRQMPGILPTRTYALSSGAAWEIWATT